MDEHLSADRALIAAFWSVVAERGWGGATMARLAAASGRSMAELRARFPDRLAVLRLHLAVVDRTVLSTVTAGESESVHDRLHDVIMCRVEALQPSREGILRLAEELPRDPLLVLALMPDLLRSMAWMLDAARIETSGATGALRAKGLLAVWLSVLRAWREDEGADLAHTMAEADKALTRAGDWARRLGLAQPDP